VRVSVLYYEKLKNLIKKNIVFGGSIPSYHNIDENVKVNLEDRLNWALDASITYLSTLFFFKIYLTLATGI
jgi:hypothetical protein